MTLSLSLPLSAGFSQDILAIPTHSWNDGIGRDHHPILGRTTLFSVFCVCAHSTRAHGEQNVVELACGSENGIDLLFVLFLFGM